MRQEYVDPPWSFAISYLGQGDEHESSHPYFMPFWPSSSVVGKIAPLCQGIQQVGKFSRVHNTLPLVD